MSTISDFDRRAAAWLADGPTELSDRVLDAALREVHQMRQQRRTLLSPRRFLSMQRVSVLAAAIFVILASGILILGGGALGPGPTSTPAAPTNVAQATGTLTPAPTMPPPSATFTSPWYGYTVSYPAGWQTTPGQGPWPMGEQLQHRNPHLDELRGPVGGSSARLVGASIALPAGMDVSGFRAFASPPGTTCKSLAPLQEPVLIDGAVATVTLNGCSSLSELGGLIWDVVVVSGGRGYDFTIDGALTAAEAQAWLRTIKLDPAAALAASPMPS